MTKAWNLSELRAEFRIYTGRPSAGQISDVAINDLINDYYVNHFSNDAKVDEFDTFFTQALSATDDGVYDLSQQVDRLDDPVTINGNPIKFFRDRESFFLDLGHHHRGHHHHFLSLTILHNTHFRKFEDEQFITPPTLVIGSSDSTKVKNSAFDYSINDFAYSKASSEVDLTGSPVSQGKFGAWSLKINTGGTITVAQASIGASTVIGTDLNEYVATASHTATAATRPITGASFATVWQATGGTGLTETWESGVSYSAGGVDFDTPRKALEGLVSSDSSSAYMGYVTVVKSDGAFTPASTALDAANVTATFTDGRFEGRTTPISALLYGQKLYVFPKPNDIYQLKALQIADRPTALSGDADAPADTKWGPAIALQTAILFMEKKDGQDVTESLQAQKRYFFDSIRSDKNKRLLGGVVRREF